MNNGREIKGKVVASLFANSDMDFEDFSARFSSETLIDANLQVIDSKGELHTFQISTLLELDWEDKEAKENDDLNG